MREDRKWHNLETKIALSKESSEMQVNWAKKYHKACGLAPCLVCLKVPSFFTLSPSHQFLTACMEY
jgi:hypothetical protein